ncbi:C-C chemokine receptor type 10 [Hoplias malabaricus]|uniref:C-C chemokine receptor type 10 n=1 Tax=Hoplias malabaricus TaxID=27720 RepID=UPI003462DE6B
MGDYELSTAYDEGLTDWTLAVDYTDYEHNSTDMTNIPEICEGWKSEETAVMVIQITVFVIVFVLGVIGNGLVIATFTCFRCLRLRCMTDVLLFYLALSDLLLLLTLPLQTAEAAAWKMGDILCKLNNGMCAINSYGGLLLLACISVDRYLVVVCARAAHKLRPIMLRYSKLSVVTVALISVIFSLPELRFFAMNQGKCRMKIVGVKNIELVKKLARVAKITGFCIPCVAMIVCYSSIGHVLLQSGGKNWRRQRTLRLMGALVLLFLLFQLPYTILLCVRLFITPTECELWNEIHLSEDITRSLAYVRCCLNPVLYALMGVRFRNDVMRLLQDWGCAPSCLKHMMPQTSYGSSATPSSPPPTTTVSPLSSAYCPVKNTFVFNGTPSETQAQTKESGVPNTCILPAQQSHKDPTYVSWGQH